MYFIPLNYEQLLFFAEAFFSGRESWHDMQCFHSLSRSNYALPACLTKSLGTQLDIIVPSM